MGDSFTDLDIIPISFTPSGFTATTRVNINYSLDNGVTWKYIGFRNAFASGAQQTFNWHVPDGINSSVDIRLRFYDGTTNQNVIVEAINITSANPSSLTITAPLIGDNWSTDPADVPQIIRWNRTNITGNILVYYTYNGRERYVGSSAGDSIQWTPPAVISSDVSIRLASGIFGAVSDTFSLTSSNPSFFDFTFPTDSDTLLSGSAYDITWNSNIPATDFVQLYFSSDGGQTFTFIDDGFQNSGLYPWIAPDLTCEKCLLNLRDNVGLFEAYSDTFSIAAGNPTVYLNSPAAGFNYFTGSNINISWTKFNIDSLNIDYDLGDGNGWINLAQNITSLNYSWPIVDSLKSDMARVRVYDNSGIAADTSGIFTITERELVFNTPTNISNPDKNSTFTIDYTANYSQGKWAVSFRQSPDSVWIEIVDQSFFFTTYDWTTPDVDGLFQLRAINNFYPDQTFYSEIFGIGEVVPSMNITSPNGGENFLSGTTEYIKWTQLNILDSDSIRADIYDGSQWVNVLSDINTNIPDSVAFQVPVQTGMNYLARVYSPTAMVSDSSDNSFSVSQIPYLTITSPNGGESFFEQDSLIITWQGTESLDPNDQLQVSLSLDGSSYTTLTTNSSGFLNGRFAFYLPDTISDNYNTSKVSIARISDGLSDTSDFPFNINKLDEITFLHPARGDSIQMLQNFNVILGHGSSSINEDLQFSYQLNGTGPWIQLATRRRNVLQGDTLVSLAAPDIGVLDSANLSLRVYNVQKDAADTLFNMIVWNNPSVTFNTPDPGSILQSNEVFNLSIHMTGQGSEGVIIDKSLDSAKTFSRLISFTSAANITDYQFNVSIDIGLLDSVQAYLIVSNPDRNVSDTVSVIIYQNRSINIIDPTQNQLVMANSDQRIKITQGDHNTNDRLNFYQSLDSGNNWSLFSSKRVFQLNGPDDNYLDFWEVPDIGSDTLVKVLVAVENEERAVSDTSEFLIFYTPDLIIETPFENQVILSATHTIAWNNGDFLSSDVFNISESTNGAGWNQLHQGTLPANQDTYDYNFDTSGEILIAVSNLTRNVSDTVSVIVCSSCPTIVVETPQVPWALFNEQSISWYYPSTEPSASDTLEFFISSDSSNWDSIGK